jgi:osmotically-inducible protein OsmY
MARILPCSASVDATKTSEIAGAPDGSQQRSYASAIFAPFSDAWLAARGRFAVLARSGAAAAGVSIIAYHGRLVLEGDVGDPDVRAEAEAAVRNVPGVVGVDNRLRVPGEHTRRGIDCDDEIRAVVATRLRRAPVLRESTIRVASVYDRVVTLSGIASPRASAAAFEVAIRIPGVRRVVNDIATPIHAGAGTAADAA